MVTNASEIARKHGIAPRLISDLFYARKLDENRCPIVGGRRVIPLEYVPEVERALRDAGRIPSRDMGIVLVGGAQ